MVLHLWSHSASCYSSHMSANPACGLSILSQETVYKGPWGMFLKKYGLSLMSFMMLSQSFPSAPGETGCRSDGWRRISGSSGHVILWMGPAGRYLTCSWMLGLPIGTSNMGRFVCFSFLWSEEKAKSKNLDFACKLEEDPHVITASFTAAWIIYGFTR